MISVSCFVFCMVRKLNNMTLYFTLFNELLQIAGKGKYKLTDSYIYHIRTTVSDKEMFIVTSQRVMYIIRGYWTGSYKVPICL